MIPAQEHGLYLGRSLVKSPRRVVQPLWDDGEGHLITFAPTGAGKGVSCIIPALLTWDGPAVVIDPKGENHAVTADRRRALGHRVAVLDPFGVTDCADPDRLNPLDLVDPNGPFAADNAAVITKLITQGGYFRADPFWDERAESLITGLILHVLRTSEPGVAELGQVRAHIESSAHQQQILAQRMACGPCVETSAAANILAILADHRVRTSIIATASSHLSFLRSGPVQRALGPSTIDLRDIFHGCKLTLYLVLPPDKLSSHAKLLRLWLGVVMTVLARRRRRPQRPTLLLIDEAAQLGTLDPLRAAVTLMRGYGVRCWSFWQDLSQLKRIYPDDWPSLVNNCAVQQYFGMGAPQASAELQAYLGGSFMPPLSRIKPDEALLIRRGHPPEAVVRAHYLRDAMFVGMFAPNPFYAADAVSAPDALPGPSNVVAFPGGSR
jgi:type IV secretion system protein VirD4